MIVHQHVKQDVLCRCSIKKKFVPSIARGNQNRRIRRSEARSTVAHTLSFRQFQYEIH
jgi:hypothetical protein